MILKIDTGKKDIIKIIIEKNGDILISKEKRADYDQAEILLPFIHDILREKKIDLSEITKIQVENKGDSFTSLRIGIITANALGYALGIEVEDFEGKNTSFKQNKDKMNHEVRQGVPRVESALGQKISLVAPAYNKEPNITVKK